MDVGSAQAVAVATVLTPSLEMTHSAACSEYRSK
jgi:hypothetical protein